MRAVLVAPLVGASGKIAGLAAGYHARTNKKTGAVTIAKNGSPYARYAPTSAQLAVQERFRQMARQPRKKRRTADGE